MGLFNVLFGLFSSSGFNQSASYTPPPYVPPPPLPPIQNNNGLNAWQIRSGHLGSPPTGIQAQSGYWNSNFPIMATGRFHPAAISRLNLNSEPLDIPIVDTTSLFDQKLPQEMLSKFVVNGKNPMLKQSDYKASGGEGTVYVKNGVAYKIYHDPSKMIPTGKIAELSQLTRPNILGPKDIIYLDNKPVGFTMSAIQDTEFLCKLFTKGFRDKNGVTPDDTAFLVKIMQSALEEIHTKNILVVDYNEMNFLTDNSFKSVFHIDVDSWQTPSYPATAIMESIRDRQVKNRKFTTGSDWFSFACVAFQLYVGCHPYKGRHPDYAPKDWLEMMNKGVSVFNKKCKLPPACQTLDVIPKGHLKWFEAVLEKGDRSAPPQPDAVNVLAGPVTPQILSSNNGFNIALVRQYDSNIDAVRFINGICYVATKKTISSDGKLWTTFAPESGYVAQRTTKDFLPCQGGKPLLVLHNKIEAKISIRTFEQNPIEASAGEGFFIANDALYTVKYGSLTEFVAVDNGRKITVMQKPIANVFDNHKVYDGLVVQDMLGTCRFSIPYEAGKCSTVHIRELDKVRIIDARFERGIAIVMAEIGGRYDRYVFAFDKECKNYAVRVDKDATLEDINFGVKDNGVVVAAKGDHIEVFVDNAKVKHMPTPLNNNEPLVIFKNDTYIVNRDGLYKVSSR